jgi:hypothetical protein
MPGTDDLVADHEALVERAAVVGAFVAAGGNLVSNAYYHDLLIVNRCNDRFSRLETPSADYLLPIIV